MAPSVAGQRNHQDLGQQSGQAANRLEAEPGLAARRGGATNKAGGNRADGDRAGGTAFPRGRGRVGMGAAEPRNGTGGPKAPGPQPSVTAAIMRPAHEGGHVQPAA